LRSGEQLIYNLGNGSGFSVLEVHRIGPAASRPPYPLEVCPVAPGDPRPQIASSEKIEME